MIDLHTHILPGVDDGLSDWSEFISAARDAKANGIDKIVATPHVIDGSLSRKQIEDVLNHGKTKTSIKMYYGAEINILWAAGKEADFLRDYTLDMNGRTLLVELPHTAPVLGTNDFFMQLRNEGFIPILSHAERYHYLGMADYRELKSSGVYYQVNIGSFFGEHGPQAKSIGFALLNNGLISILASDLHRLDDCPNLYCHYKNDLEKFIPVERLALFFERNPEKVLKGEEPI